MQTDSKNLSETPSRLNGQSITKKAQTSQLMELYEEQLKDILWAEKALIKSIPKMITLATSDELIIALTDNLHRTHEQITRLAKVFRIIFIKPTTIKCEAMEGMIKEASELMKGCERGPKCDAGIIAASQKIQHYKIATYGTLREFSKTLGLEEAETLLITTLDEEKETDKKFTDVAVQGVNQEAASAQLQPKSNLRAQNE